MIRILQLVLGMRVVTPRGHIARVEGYRECVEDVFQRVELHYLNRDLGSVYLQAKMLKPYIGPPVIFPDEAEAIRKRHGDKPLGRSGLILPVGD